MEIQDFNLGFDILYNNIMSNQAPGLTPYEKSVFLTKAQDEILKNYFNPGGNKYKQGFDQNRKREVDFSMLVEVSSPTEDTGAVKFIPNSFVFSLPEDLFFILNESCSATKGDSSTDLVIMPLSYEELQRLMNKTYKAPYKWQCWRFMSKSKDGSKVELIPGYGYESCTYKVRYIRYPSPIILETLTDGLNINGKTTQSNCELSPEIHQEILQRAVEIAKNVWVGDNKSLIELGNRSE